MVPEGDFETNLEGETYQIEHNLVGKTSFRSILDLDRANIFPKDVTIGYFGFSSDIIILDLGENLQDYKVGDLLESSINYMGALRAMNSNYIEQKVI
jgi:predicted amino acid racemase